MNNAINWTVDAVIKEGQQDALMSVMHDLIAAAEQEQGTLKYDWSIADDKRTIHVKEHYQDAASAFEHLGNFGLHAERFLAAVDITKFAVYSELPKDLAEAVSGLSPVYMTPLGGLTK